VELPGTAYLYTLATVSISFVGFSALLLVFRQSMGGALTRYDTYFTLTFIQVGFLVTAGALIPPLFALFGWPESRVWAVSDVSIALPVLAFTASVPSRRRAATGTPVPAFVWTLLAVQAGSALALLSGAAGVLPAGGAAVLASALTAILFSSGVAYLLALNVILPELTETDPRRPGK